MRNRWLLPLLLVASVGSAAEPVRIGVVGLVHGHVGWILNREPGDQVDMVGIAEPNRELAQRLSKRHGFSMEIVYPTVEEMLDAVKPDAVADFGAIAGHRATIEAAADRGVDVMVEKPLAFTREDGAAIDAAAKRGGIHVLTNYETTWYATVHRIREMVREGVLGPVRKIVVRDGHSGPIEIGVAPQFEEWLLDPKQNGGGAITDFGCYGADLSVWLMGGRKPVSVTALAQTIKPEKYPEVDDEATILLEYPEAQVIIQASWNWPFARKDMAVYGATGYAKGDGRTGLRVRLQGEPAEKGLQLAELSGPEGDPFDYLAAVVRGEVDPEGSLWSLDVNLKVVEILAAARESARTGRRIRLD